MSEENTDRECNKMKKVNVWLKRSYIIATSLIGIISALLLAFTLFSHGYLHEDEEFEKAVVGLQFMYVISIVTLVLAIIGVFGACKEKKWALIVFAVGMILGSLYMCLHQIISLIAVPQIVKALKEEYLDMLPLTNSSESVLEGLNKIQAEIQCCGVDQGYLDWNYVIPESCMCTEESTHPCVAAPSNSSLFENNISDKPIMIYEKPCLQYIIEQILSLIGILLGIMLGVTLLWVLSVVLCIIILCQLNQKVGTPKVLYSQEAKSGNYTILTESVVLS